MKRREEPVLHGTALGRALTARAVLFDMDGVLTLNGPFHGQAWQRFARERLALTLTENDPRIHGGRTEEILTALTGRVPDAEAIRACEIAKEGYYRSLARGNLRPVPGLIPYLDLLAERGVPCALVTSADVVNVAFVLSELGLTGRFPIKVSAEDVRRGKPDPEPYLLAAARIGVDPACCLVHEDAPSGIRSAINAGCAVVAVTTTFPAELLQAAGAELHVPDFAAWLALSETHRSGLRT
jgi:HAD superfamily hydrolase (TIGR01509 family)